MRNKITAVFLLFLVIGCTTPSDLEKVYNPIRGFKTGAWQIALIVEATTNFSSLLYDKTEADFESFNVRALTVLPLGSSYYILPSVNFDGNGIKSYDDAYKRLIASYLKINNYGSVTDVLEEADYVVLVEVKESVVSFNGQNRSQIAVTITEKDETPVFFANTRVVSSADANFYYRPSKYAKPVKYLTLKGFERLFKEGLPQMYAMEG